jgi:hypothetical protein
MMTEAGDMWRRFALACARACKSKTADFDVKEIAQLLRKCAAQEKLVYSLLKSVEKYGRPLAAGLDKEIQSFRKWPGSKKMPD